MIAVAIINTAAPHPTNRLFIRIRRMLWRVDRARRPNWEPESISAIISAVSELEHDERPWGSYLVLSDETDHKVKRLVVHPGRRLSYQKHAKRAEHWFVVAGRGVVTLDGERHELGPGESIDIPVQAAHRIECTGDAPLVFIEVQRGEYFGEDDIERLEDDFGRS